MILIITYDKKNLLTNKEGLLVLNVKFYGQHANTAFMTTAENPDKTDEKLENMKPKKHGYLMVGPNGGISIDSYRR